jgi:hypothetical protein
MKYQFLLMETVLLKKKKFLYEINRSAFFQRGMLFKKLMREDQGGNSFQ